VQGLNVVRIISLFYLGQWNMTAFEWAHLYIWQALIMLDVLIVWLIWVRRINRSARNAQPPEDGGSMTPSTPVTA
jgi:exosortase/archaeosortase family protein